MENKNNNHHTIMFLSLALVCIMSLSHYSYAQQQTFTLDLKSSPGKNSYNNVIQSIKSFSKSKQFIYDGIPMLDIPSSPPVYSLVKIVAMNGNKDISLTVAINKTNLYLVAYADESARLAWFFSDSIGAMSVLFPHNFVKKSLGYDGGYKTLEAKAKLFRHELTMSLENLRFYLLGAYGGSNRDVDFPKKQARFLLIAIQAFSEATRFTYVQNKFLAGSGIGPVAHDFKVESLENNWETISESVKKAVKRKFNRPVKLTYANASTWVVQTVDEIKPDMGILLYVK